MKDCRGGGGKNIKNYHKMMKSNSCHHGEFLLIVESSRFTTALEACFDFFQQ